MALDNLYILANNRGYIKNIESFEGFYILDIDLSFENLIFYYRNSFYYYYKDEVSHFLSKLEFSKSVKI